MKNIPERVEKEIIQLAKQYDIQKVILFGSRARGDNWERSDIDLAVSGGDISRFALDLDEEVWTLLLFDVVNLDEPVQPALLKEIARDGVLIYEKV
ncbi:nucleotidyltransferase family protein [uncultured Ruminococcus sp.]|uniref:nucleotidyltransferase family protein n=1 Tax=uncultured Ruminococcus sp. TaxID=165186 RepID=UPI002675907C|nr:nucleotidyltransferase domain-containing protein [uncultured Ruminococcus sp.]